MGKRESVYTSLDDSKSEIRLIELLLTFGLGAGYPECRLHIRSLDERPIFMALSYVWGDAKVTTDILVEGRKFPITMNLARALSEVCKMFRSVIEVYDYTKLFFVDAICINQSNLNERSSQVQMMGRIFSSATEVVSWIGMSNCALAFDTIETLYTAAHEHGSKNLQQLFSSEWMRMRTDLWDVDEDLPDDLIIPNVAWHAIWELLGNEYWRRVWVFQELALAQTSLVLGRGAIMRMDTLIWVCSQISSLAERCRVSMVEIPIYMRMRTWQLIATDVLDTSRVCRPTLWRKRWELKGQHGPLIPVDDIYEFMLEMYGMKATDPKDHICGVLGMTPLTIIPDYTGKTSMSAVFCDFVERLLEIAWSDGCYTERSSFPLQFLALAGSELMVNRISIASWAPHYPFGSRSDWQKRFTCVAGLANRILFREIEEHHAYVRKDQLALHTWGVQVDKVRCIVELAIDGASNMLELTRGVCVAYTDHQLGMRPMQALFRLFSQRSSPVIDRAMIIHALAFMMWIVTEGHNKQDDELPIHLERFWPASTCDSFDARFLDSFFPGVDLLSLGFDEGLDSLMGGDNPVSRLLINYRLQFRSLINALEEDWVYFQSDGGRMGLVPRGAQKGDSLALLKYCDLPIVMRPARGGAWYTFVGTSYVVGMMNGEMADFVNGPDANCRWFEFR